MNNLEGHFYLEGYPPMAATVRTLEDPESVEVKWKSGPWSGTTAKHSVGIMTKFQVDAFNKETVEFKGIDVVQHSPEEPDPFETKVDTDANQPPPLSEWDMTVRAYIEARNQALHWEKVLKEIRDEILPDLASGELFAATDENGLSHRLKLDMRARTSLDVKAMVQAHPEAQAWIDEFTKKTEYSVITVVPFNDEAEARREATD